MWENVTEREAYRRGNVYIYGNNPSMVSKVTEGVKVMLESYYQPEYSNPINGEYMFAYRVTIENHNSFPVQILRRHWYIFDSNATRREVEGEGVVGVQPVIQPGGRYQYVSGCNLKTEIGSMHGMYTVLDMDTHRLFNVRIPVFAMTAPFKLN